ncbi:hypothetical protein PPROV_000044400 [Pycnococcus provasolii]|uniref:Uncharacterized protein n=1 Tax=Pycnococcus provasolii TaxID=41880 RepID=A0A830H938_9CHLO|nr:hypothetical protein PPROV_000044400 [Pycnococcus provasolii]
MPALPALQTARARTTRVVMTLQPHANAKRWGSKPSLPLRGHLNHTGWHRGPAGLAQLGCPEDETGMCDNVFKPPLDDEDQHPDALGRDAHRWGPRFGTSHPKGLDQMGCGETEFGVCETDVDEFLPLK